MDLPRSINRIIDRGIRELAPEQILIFGSRARGDHHDKSDFDLAFFGVSNKRAWQEFSADMIYEPPTLFRLDVVRFETVPPELQASILRDGKVIYRRDESAEV